MHSRCGKGTGHICSEPAMHKGNSNQEKTRLLHMQRTNCHCSGTGTSKVNSQGAMVTCCATGAFGCATGAFGQYDADCAGDYLKRGERKATPYPSSNAPTISISHPQCHNYKGRCTPVKYGIAPQPHATVTSKARQQYQHSLCVSANKIVEEVDRLVSLKAHEAIMDRMYLQIGQKKSMHQLLQEISQPRHWSKVE